MKYGEIIPGMRVAFVGAASGIFMLPPEMRGLTATVLSVNEEGSRKADPVMAAIMGASEEELAISLDVVISFDDVTINAFEKAAKIDSAGLYAPEWLEKIEDDAPAKLLSDDERAKMINATARAIERNKKMEAVRVQLEALVADADKADAAIDGGTLLTPKVRSVPELTVTLIEGETVHQGALGDIRQATLNVYRASDNAHIGYVGGWLQGDRLFADHTETFEEHRLQGLGRAIVYKTLEWAKEKGYGVVPTCPFYHYVMKSMPEYREWLQQLDKEAEAKIAELAAVNESHQHTHH